MHVAARHGHRRQSLDNDDGERYMRRPHVAGSDLPKPFSPGRSTERRKAAAIGCLLKVPSPKAVRRLFFWDLPSHKSV
jgi:hypothetical protein